MTMSYWRQLRLIRREAWLVMSARATFSLVQRGVFVVVFNLYLLRMGYGPQFIGLINGVWLLTYAGLALPAGLLARRWSIRPLLILGKALEAAGFTLVALADLLPGPWQTGWLLATYTLAGIGGAAWGPAASVALFSATGHEERDHAFSVSAASVPAAGFVGNLLGGAMPGLFAAALALNLGEAAPYRLALLVAGLVDFTAVLALLHTSPGQAAGARQETRDGARFPFGIVAMMSLCWLLYAAAYGPMMTFINVYLSAHLEMTVAAVGLILGTARLLSIPASLASPMLAARWGRFRACVVMLSAPATGFVLLLLLPHWLTAGVAFAVALTCFLFFTAIATVYAQELVAPQWRATISGGASMALGLGLGIVSLVGGYVISAWGYPALFALSAVFALGSSGLFWAYFRLPHGDLRPVAPPRPSPSSWRPASPRALLENPEEADPHGRPGQGHANRL